jgi:hypothetical protein
MSDLKIRAIDEAVLYSQSRRSAKLRNQDRICTQIDSDEKEGKKLRPWSSIVCERETVGAASHGTARVVSDMIYE